MSENIPSQNTPPQPKRFSVRAALGRILVRKNSENNPSPLSASRGPAAEALQAANYTEPTAAPKSPERLSDIPPTAANALPDVPALHTYKGDIASKIQEQQISLATIAQAEAERARRTQPEQTANGNWLRRNWIRVAEVAFGLLFIASSAGILAWSYLRIAPLPSVPAATAPYIYVDQKKEVTVSLDDSRETLMQTLTSGKSTEVLPLGLVEQISLMVASSSGPRAPLTTRTFFSMVAQKAPDSLVRSLAPQFLLGLHSTQGNQPFLIFKSTSYEQAFAGMLEWEYSIQDDLAPLFPKSIESALLEIATTSAASTSPPVQYSAPRIIKTSFLDSTLQNHDTRVVRDAGGTVVFLWSFVDRQTLLITTQADTLAEIISRLQKAPTITVPSI